MSKSVNLKGGNNILFSLKNREKPVFSLFRYLEIFFTKKIFLEDSLLGSTICACIIFCPYFNFSLDFYLQKGLKSPNFAIFGSTVFKKLLFDTQKMLSGSWNFFWASPTVPSRNFSPWYVHPCHVIAPIWNKFYMVVVHDVKSLQ